MIAVTVCSPDMDTWPPEWPATVVASDAYYASLIRIAALKAELARWKENCIASGESMAPCGSATETT